MIKIENYEFNEPSKIGYGGHSGGKRGIIIDNERWFLKYPKSTKSMEVEGISYTTMPLSEFLGSHIYDLIGIETHETRLGTSDRKLVVACKDFLNNSEIILDYNILKNEYNKFVEQKLESLLSSNSKNDNNDLDEIMIIMNNNSYFKKVPKLKKRFWDMFIIDAFISNNDRNEGNWGLILNKENSNLRISPVFDNGACFNNKASDEKLESLLKDDSKFKESVYNSASSIFVKNDKKINPLKFIESMQNQECNEALLRVFPNIDMSEIKELFDGIPNEYNGLSVFSDAQKKFYFKSLEYKYNNILKAIYNILINR